VELSVLNPRGLEGISIAMTRAGHQKNEPVAQKTGTYMGTSVGLVNRLDDSGRVARTFQFCRRLCADQLADMDRLGSFHMSR
jgi:hypothetical protein